LRSRLILKPSLVRGLSPRRGWGALFVIAIAAVAAIAALLLLVLCLGSRGRNVAVLCGGRDASLAGLVENQHGRATLETGVSTLAGPVTVAGFAQGNVAVSVILAKGMFLASSDILGPVARVSFLVVEEAADAKLLGRGAVPASPVSGARCLMSENSVQPVAVFGALRRVVAFFAAAFGPVRVVADPDQPVPTVAGIDKAVGASPQNGLALFDLAFAAGLLVIHVAILFVRQRAVLALAVD